MTRQDYHADYQTSTSNADMTVLLSVFLTVQISQIKRQMWCLWCFKVSPKGNCDIHVLWLISGALTANVLRLWSSSSIVEHDRKLTSSRYQIYINSNPKRVRQRLQKRLVNKRLKGEAPQLIGDDAKKFCLIMRANLFRWPEDVHFWS